MRSEWFAPARFGMFIHWGLYAIPGGIWHGEEMSYIGEWLQSCFRVPCREYEQLAEQFNPVNFDARQYCRMASEAGMRYVIFTTKHHDGFAMYHSKVDAFNVVDATPFGRDPLAELAAACAEYRLKLGLYYSQDLDWRHPDGGDPGPESPKNHGMSWGNDWDYPDHDHKCFRRYFDTKVLPQLTELLSNYGPVSIVWFDCPLTISRSESEELVALIRRLQPECLINTRIGHGLGDYGSYGDNQLPAARSTGCWETPGTLNRTWGFKWHDHDWKTPAEVVGTLAALAEKNTNYLLNVGPMPDGSLPPETVRILRQTGEWLRGNGAAIYGSVANPFPTPFDWGYVTMRVNPGEPTVLYLILREFRSELRLYGLREKILRCRELTTGEAVAFRNTDDAAPVLWPPERWRGELLPVIAVELDGCGVPQIAEIPMSHEGVLRLPAAQGRLRHCETASGDEAGPLRGLGAAGERLDVSRHSRFDRTGNLVEWHNPNDRIEWRASFAEAGNYRIEIATISSIHGAPWKSGQKIELVIGECTVLNRTLSGNVDSGPDDCYARGSADAGVVPLPSGGEFDISLRMLEATDPDALAMALVEVRFIRMASC